MQQFIGCGPARGKAMGTICGHQHLQQRVVLTRERSANLEYTLIAAVKDHNYLPVTPPAVDGHLWRSVCNHQAGLPADPIKRLCKAQLPLGQLPGHIKFVRNAAQQSYNPTQLPGKTANNVSRPKFAPRRRTQPEFAGEWQRCHGIKIRILNHLHGQRCTMSAGEPGGRLQWCTMPK
jgi:hypothetical protein